MAEETTPKNPETLDEPSVAVPPTQQGLHLWEIGLLALISIGLVASAAFGGRYLMENKPKPTRTPPPEMAPLVEVADLNPGDHQVIITVNGNVMPAVEVSLQARVTGRVEKVHPEWVEGGLVKAGETLVQLDDSDYALTLTNSQTQLDNARNELALEQGQQDVAKAEWDLLDLKQSASKLDEELALRLPYLRIAESKVRAAETSVAIAQLNLERTKVKAPFNAILLNRGVNVGDQATPQTPLANLVGTDSFWVQVSVPVDELKWLQLPNGTETTPTRANVISTGTGAKFEGQILKLMADLEPNGLMAQIIVEVKDPLRLADGSDARLLLGEFVRVELFGKSAKGVTAIPRDALHDGTMLWLADGKSKLHVRDTTVVWGDEETALVTPWETGLRLIVSDIAAPVENTRVRIRGEEVEKTAPEAQEAQ